MDIKNYLNLLDIESQIEDVQKWFSNNKIDKQTRTVEQETKHLAQLDNKRLEVLSSFNDVLN